MFFLLTVQRYVAPGMRLHSIAFTCIKQEHDAHFCAIKAHKCLIFFKKSINFDSTINIYQ